MNLYKTNNQLAFLLDQCYNYETGEINPLIWEQIENIEIDREAKLLDLACDLKEGRALEEAIKSQEKALEARRKRLQSRNDSIESNLTNMLNDKEVLEDGRVRITTRTSEETITDDVDLEELIYISDNINPQYSASLYNRKTIITPNKKTIKVYLEAGNEIDGCYIKNKRNLISQ